MPDFRVKATKKRYHNSRLQMPGDVFVMSNMKKKDLPKDVEVVEEVGKQSQSTSGDEAEGEKSAQSSEPEGKTLAEVGKDNAEPVTAPKTSGKKKGDS